MLSRRTLLQLGGGLAGSGLAATLSVPLPVRAHSAGGKHAVTPALRPFVDPLPRLHRAEPTGTHEGSPLFEIPVRAFRAQLHRDLPPTALWGYGGQFPGPLFDVKRGQRIFVRWQNEL